MEKTSGMYQTVPETGEYFGSLQEARVLRTYTYTE